MFEKIIKFKANKNFIENTKNVNFIKNVLVGLPFQLIIFGLPVLPAEYISALELQ